MLTVPEVAPRLNDALSSVTVPVDVMSASASESVGVPVVPVCAGTVRPSRAGTLRT